MNVEDLKEKREHKVGNIVKYFGGIMGLFYTVLGSGIIFNKVPLMVGTEVKYILGLAMLLYGLFRIYRIFRISN